MAAYDYPIPDGEHLTGGELDEYVKQVVTTGPLQEAGPETLPPKDIMRYTSPLPCMLHLSIVIYDLTTTLCCSMHTHLTYAMSATLYLHTQVCDIHQH